MQPRHGRLGEANQESRAKGSRQREQVGKRQGMQARKNFRQEQGRENGAKDHGTGIRSTGVRQRETCLVGNPQSTASAIAYMQLLHQSTLMPAAVPSRLSEQLELVWAASRLLTLPRSFKVLPNAQGLGFLGCAWCRVLRRLGTYTSSPAPPGLVSQAMSFLHSKYCVFTLWHMNISFSSESHSGQGAENFCSSPGRTGIDLRASGEGAGARVDTGF